MLTRDDILKSKDMEAVPVEVPEWGGSVLVRGLSAIEYARFQQSMIAQVKGKTLLNMADMYGNLVYLGCMDEDGKRLFTQEDVIALGNKSAIAMSRVSDVIRLLSGMTDADVEALTQNFTMTPSGVSASS